MKKCFTETVRGSKSYPEGLDIYLGPYLAPLIGLDRGVKALDLAGITHVGDLVALTVGDLARVPGLKPGHIGHIRSWLRGRGFELGQPDQGWLAYARQYRLKAKLQERRRHQARITAPAAAASGFHFLG